MNSAQWTTCLPRKTRPNQGAGLFFRAPLALAIGVLVAQAQAWGQDRGLSSSTYQPIERQPVSRPQSIAGQAYQPIQSQTFQPRQTFSSPQTSPAQRPLAPGPQSFSTPIYQPIQKLVPFLQMQGAATPDFRSFESSIEEWEQGRTGAYQELLQGQLGDGYPQGNHGWYDAWGAVEGTVVGGPPAGAVMSIAGAGLTGLKLMDMNLTAMQMISPPIYLQKRGSDGVWRGSGKVSPADDVTASWTESLDPWNATGMTRMHTMDVRVPNGWYHRNLTVVNPDAGRPERAFVTVAPTALQYEPGKTFVNDHRSISQEHFEPIGPVESNGANMSPGNNRLPAPPSGTTFRTNSTPSSPGSIQRQVSAEPQYIQTRPGTWERNPAWTQEKIKKIEVPK